jgi:hypothetical protein
VEELRSIAGRLRIKYYKQIDRKIERALHQEQQEQNGKPAGAPKQIIDVMDKASNLAGGLFAKMKSPGFSAFKQVEPKAAASEIAWEPAPTIVDLPPPAPKSNNSSNDGDWVGTDIAPATDAISNFSIGDDEDDDIL